MRIIRPIALIFYYFTRLFSGFYLASAAYTLLAIVLKHSLADSATTPMRIVEGATELRYEILIPFTDMPIFLGHYTIWGMIEIPLAMTLYGIFFYLLSQIFNAFRQDKLFTPQAIAALMKFAQANVLLPPAFLIFLYLHTDYLVEGGEILVTGLHFLLAVFAFFQAAIFKEGFTLQQEQDLTI